MPDEQPGRVGGRFAAGNPGRPKGARSKLGAAFLDALLTDFQTGGIAAIKKVRAEDPSTYLRVISNILPKELTGEDGEALFSGITVNFIHAGDKPNP